MVENKETGKLYQKMSAMIGFLEQEQKSVLISHRCNIIEVLDEAKAEAYYEAPTDEWCAQDYVDNYNSLRRWFEKWFGT